MVQLNTIRKLCNQTQIWIHIKANDFNNLTLSFVVF